MTMYNTYLRKKNLCLLLELDMWHKDLSYTQYEERTDTAVITLNYHEQDNHEIFVVFAISK